MLTTVYGAKCIGIEAVPVAVEIDIASGIGIHLVGLADAAVKESLLRTVTAMQSMGYRIPGKKIVINLAPADMHKKGSGYDLPIAVGIIAASAQERLPLSGKFIIMGELGLDGTVRPVPGALPIAELASIKGFDGCILPFESATEAAGYDLTELYGVRTLSDVIHILNDEDREQWSVKRGAPPAGQKVLPAGPDPAGNSPIQWPHGMQDTISRMETGTDTGDDIMDFSEIVGQEGAKRGLEIAAAGGHNVIMVGPPGAGKSSLARAMVRILPPMDREEALQTSKIYSVAGKGRLGNGFSCRRPFRSPHYSTSVAALIGGGSDNILPGEISLAHNGVLFLDEFCEAPKRVTEALRAPVEEKRVTISRLKVKIEYPANFMLIAATNPCPCGYYGDGDRCTCSPARRMAYLSRLSGPMMDRIDIHLWLKPVNARSIVRKECAEPSRAIAERVSRARYLQMERFSAEGIRTNSEMNGRQIKEYCRLSPECRDFLEKAVERTGMSARACNRILKIARTIADLQEDTEIGLAHLSEAISYRFLDKPDIL